MSIYFGSTTDEELISELEQRGFHVKKTAKDEMIEDELECPNCGEEVKCLE